MGPKLTFEAIVALVLLLNALPGNWNYKPQCPKGCDKGLDTSPLTEAPSQYKIDKTLV